MSPTKLRLALIPLFLLSNAVHAWEPGYPKGKKSMPTTGFKVNANSRDDVVAFYHAIYTASEGYQDRVKWNGKFPNQPGKTSKEFSGDIERRINFFRALCGVPGTAKVNTGSRVVVSNGDRFQPKSSTTKESAAQEMAMLIAASYDPTTGSLPGMSHDPDPGLNLWSEEAWNAAAKGSLAFGVYGPDAITEYITEELPQNTSVSTWNSLAGHRRWLLFPRATDYGSGDFPGESIARPSTNVLYVIQDKTEEVPVKSPSFVPYPPAGYFPVQFNARFWSLGRRGADFSQATVRVTDASGAQIPVSNVSANSSFGDPALLWTVGSSAAINKTSADRTFKVEVTGILGTGIPDSHSYEVTLINPDLLRKKTSIKGKRKVKVRSKERFKVNGFDEARSSRVVQYQRTSKAWTEDGDGKKPDVIDRTSRAYPLLAKVVGPPGGRPISGKNSFNLTFPTSFDLITRGVPEQSFELDTWFQTKNGSTLEFDYTRGIMSEGSAMDVEVSTDQGSSWTAVGKAIRGKAEPKPDQGVSKARYKLPRSRNPIRIRFRYYFAATSGALATHENSGSFPTGIFLDNFKVTKADWYRPRKISKAKRKSFRFKVPRKSKAGEQWALALESEFGGEWKPVGPFRSVRVVSK